MIFIPVAHIIPPTKKSTLNNYYTTLIVSEMMAAMLASLAAIRTHRKLKNGEKNDVRAAS